MEKEKNMKEKKSGIKESSRTESREFVEDIHDIIDEIKLRPELAREHSEVIREVFAAFAASSHEEPMVRLAAINGILQIDYVRGG